MAVNVEIQKQGSESTTNMLRRFTRRMQSSGIVRGLKSRRYYTRSPSKASRKTSALKMIARREEYETLAKLGKLTDEKKKGHGRR